jgi:hypothetical protein
VSQDEPLGKTPEQLADEKKKVRRVLGTICFLIASVPTSIGSTLLYRASRPLHTVSSPTALESVPDHHFVTIEGNHLVEETSIIEAIIGSGPTTYVSVFTDAPDIALHGSSPKPTLEGRMLPGGNLPRLGGHLESYVFEDYAESLGREPDDMRVLETGGSRVGMVIEASAGIVCTGLPFFVLGAYVFVKLR